MSWIKECTEKLKWTKNLDISVYEPYPLQFANVERIEKNNAVYIFDETGCGKTISAGLMALHYLYNNKGRKALIITVPQLVSSNQFIEEWYGGEGKPAKLPFEKCGIERERVEIINNVAQNIVKCSESHERWGLIIIDEAHCFLEAEKRREAVKQLRADKIVFMTATPIKKSGEDLEKYSKLADKILRGNVVSRDWIKRLLFNSEKGQDFICSTFDCKSPVTRYFKDTVNALSLEYNLTCKETSKGKAVKKAPIREVVLLPYQENRKIEEIANYIADNQKKETEEELQVDDERKIVLNKNRFVIFTRFIDKEARKVEEYFEKDDRFIGFHSVNPENKITYIRIDGTKGTGNIDKYTNNGFDIEYKETRLPDVIILTYQIAEAGVNLPGYNYIINYHIPAFPASLEQRFGRVDRLGKQNGSATLHRKIYMVYPLNPSPLESDTYKTNYYIANWMFRKMMIDYLPAKNTILSPKILESLVDIRSELVRRLEDFKKLCDDKGGLEKVCSQLNKLSDIKTENIKSNQEWDDDICDLIDYCDE